jgi:exonuclease SbcD
MKKVRFLHCSDIHLDMPFKYLGDSEKSAVRRRELLEVFDGIIDMAGKKGVDFLLVGGDLYEHAYTLRKTILHVREKFAQIRHVKVVMLPGNHDPYTANSFYASFDWPENVHILNADNPALRVGELGTCIYGIGWESSVTEGLKRIKNETVSPGEINILLFHGSVDMLFSKQAFNPVASDELAGLGMDYIAMGHYHNCFSAFGPARNIFNPGSPESLAFDLQDGTRGVFEVSISKEETSREEIFKEENFREESVKGENFREENRKEECGRKGNAKAKIDYRFIETGKRNHRDISINVDMVGAGEDGDIEKSARKRMKDSGGPGDLYRIFLKGYRREGMEVDAAGLAERLSGDAFFVKVLDETVEELDYEALRKTPGIKGLFTSRMLDRINAADEKEKKILERALRYGLQALDEGKVDLEV